MDGGIPGHNEVVVVDGSRERNRRGSRELSRVQSGAAVMRLRITCHRLQISFSHTQAHNFLPLFMSSPAFAMPRSSCQSNRASSWPRIERTLSVSPTGKSCQTIADRRQKNLDARTIARAHTVASSVAATGNGKFHRWQRSQARRSTSKPGHATAVHPKPFYSL